AVAVGEAAEGVHGRQRHLDALAVLVAGRVRPKLEQARATDQPGDLLGLELDAMDFTQAARVYGAVRSARWPRAGRRSSRPRRRRGPRRRRPRARSPAMPGRAATARRAGC